MKKATATELVMGLGRSDQNPGGPGALGDEDRLRRGDIASLRAGFLSHRTMT